MLIKVDFIERNKAFELWVQNFWQTHHGNA